jgi:hypothetical protein
MRPPREHCFDEPELREATLQCTSTGALNPDAVGWARRPLLRCNLSGHWPRKKRWSYWCITSQRWVFSVTIANLDYAGLAAVYFLDRERDRSRELTELTPLGRGCTLPETVMAPAHFRHPRLVVDLAMGEAGGRIAVRSPALGRGPLAADFEVTYPPGHETLNVLVPWSDHRFQFTAKHNCLPATGRVSLDGRRYELPAGTAFACLDYGRGVWPYCTAWNWGSASGHSSGHLVGLNLGGKWTDGTGMTENALCVDGRLTKIGEDLRWEYDRGDWFKPWRIATPASDRIDLSFTPSTERTARTDLFVIRSEVHQLFGHYAGTIATDDGRRVSVEGLYGWAEEHDSRW